MRVAVQRPTESWEFHSTGFAGSTTAMRFGRDLSPCIYFYVTIRAYEIPRGEQHHILNPPGRRRCAYASVEFQDIEFALWVHGDWLRDDADEVHEEEVCCH